MKPRIVQNQITAATRFLAASTFGTGVSTETTEDGGLTNVYELDSGSAGRAFITESITLVAGKWECISFEVDANSLGGATTQAGFYFSAGAPDNGDWVVLGSDIVAGGNRRYAALFMSVAGGAATYRLGVGLLADQADKTMTVKNLQREVVTLGVGGFPSEYVYPNYKAAFNRPCYSYIGANHVVTESYGSEFDVEAGQVLLAVGDSRCDEPTDIGGRINSALDGNGLCHVHAEGGWSTGALIGPTTLHTDFVTTIDKAIAGTLFHRTISTAGVEEMASNQGNVDPDVVIIANLGVNDIMTGNPNSLTAGAALENIETIMDKTIAAGKVPCVTELTPWNAYASFSETDGDQAQTYMYNRGLKELAKAKGAIFVPIYKAMGDSTDPDKLSDGVGTTPDYSVDGAHTNEEANRVIAGLILNEIQIYNQSLL